LLQRQVIVFPVGPGQGGQIGAATILYRDGVEIRTIRKHLGSGDKHTVYEAEVLGLSLAAKLIKTERHVWSATIGADSQAVILATRHARGMLGQHLLDAFHKQMASVQHKHAGIDVELRWTPGYQGIPGNDCTDEEAKKAALGQSIPQHQLPLSCRKELPTSCLATWQCHLKKVNVESVKWFESSPCCQQLCRVDPSTPLVRIRKDTSNIV